MDLSMLADFNLVAAREGFAAASRASGRSKATLSRNVRRLEDDLGTRLIERSSHAFQLTEDGRALFARSDGLLVELRELGLEIKGRSPVPRGRLRLSAPTVFSHAFLGALAADYKAAFPEVQLEATAEDRHVDLVEEEYDVVIRVNPDPKSPLVGRCFFRDRYVVAAPPGLARPPTPEPVEAVALTHRRGRGSWRVEGTPDEIAFKVGLRLPSLLMARDAVVAGAGAAALPVSIVAGDLAAGRLVAWGDLVGGAVELWVLHTSRRASSSKVLSFVDFVCERFADRRTHADRARALHI